MRFLRRSKNQTVKLFKKKPQNKTINFTSYIFSTHTLISFFHSFCWFFVTCINREELVFFLCPVSCKLIWGNHKSVKREYRHMWIIKLMICVMHSSLKIMWKTKIIFLLSKTFLFFKINFFFVLGEVFFMSPKNSIDSAFFLQRQILKNINMPRQKPRHLPTAEANSERCSINLGP